MGSMVDGRHSTLHSARSRRLYAPTSGSKHRPGTTYIASYVTTTSVRQGPAVSRLCRDSCPVGVPGAVDGEPPALGTHQMAYRIVLVKFTDLSRSSGSERNLLSLPHDPRRSFTRPDRTRTRGCASGSGRVNRTHVLRIRVWRWVHIRNHGGPCPYPWRRDRASYTNTFYLDTPIPKNDGKPCQDARPAVCLVSAIDGSTGPSQIESGANSRRLGLVTHP